MAVAGLLLVVTAHAAGAAQGNTQESRMPVNIAGPLAVIVVAIGLGGLLIGLWRLRRKTAKARAAETKLQAQREPARTS
jgi:uncharacterized membrane protein YozB (DUF420 family)